MKSYRPGEVADPILRRELLSIQQAANRADSFTALQYITVAPDRPQDGIYLAAAGVLGVSRGAYRYDSSIEDYVFLA